ncbi:MAG: hypothetical protein JSV25_05425 [Spirochaetota bacterium]|nr:MAG: hypothetical protein JSV25_05425 [Spirochaetota bacterium]
MITSSVVPGDTSRAPRITALSQIINLLVFAVFALLTRYFTTIAIQGLLIIYSIYLCRIKLKEFRLKEIIPLLPILGFVLILNCFRGSGEILLRLGPLVLMKQGILRGLYYFVVISQLWLLSKVLTKGFGEEAVLSSLHTLDRVLTKSRKRRNFVVILYYILRIFHNTYAELKIVLKHSKTASIKDFSKQQAGYSTPTLKERILLFFYASFERSKEDFEKSSRISVKKQRPVVYDYLYIALELCCMVLAFLLRTWLIEV